MGMIPFSRPSEWRYIEGTCYEVGHRWSPSCFYSNLEVTCIVFYEGLKLYLPLYLVSQVLRHRWSPHEIVKVLPHVVRSAAFLAANVGGSIFFICLLRRLFGRFYHYTSVFLPCSLGAGCALFVERRGRRPLLAGYVATIAIELTYTMLKYRNIISSLSYGEVLLFSLATAVIFHRFRTKSMEDVLGTILSTLLSPKLPGALASSLESTVLNNRLTRILLVGMWAFLLGYFLQVLLSLIGKGTRLFKERGKLRHILTNPQHFRFAAFLSSLAAGYKVVNSVLYYLPLPRDLRLLLAGLAAGLSLLFYRSSSIALYVAWKALETVYSMGVSRGWLKYIPHGEVLIYALSTGWLFHACILEGHNLRFAYWNFLRRVTWGRILQFNYGELDKFGTGASTIVNQWKDKQQREQNNSQ